MNPLPNHDLPGTHIPVEGREASPSTYALVIPAYNEAPSIREVVQKALCYIPEVIVIEDGSTDETATALDSLPITVLKKSPQYGKSF